MSWSDTTDAAPSAGWYQDPAGSGGLRYWDGTSWTGHVTPPQPRSTAPPPPAAPGAGPYPQGYLTAPPAPTASPAKTPVWVWAALAGTILLMGIGIVAAIAVPTFRIARDTVWDEEAKTNLLDAYDAAAVLRSTSGSYLQATPDDLDRTDPRFDYTTSGSTGPTNISIHPLDQRITLAVRSASGTCWVVVDDAETLGRAGFRTGRMPTGELGCAAATGTAGLVEEEF